MHIAIRKCAPVDLPHLLRLYQQLLPEDTTTSDELSSSFDAIESFPGCTVYVALSGTAIVGSFVLYILPNLTRNGRKAAVLENIVVGSAFRRQGIGRAMLEYARTVAQELGCYKLALSSNMSRREAHEFYSRCGMIQHGYSFRYSFL